MADRFAELPIGNSNYSSVNTWKATTGGATGASVPISTDNAYTNADSVQGAAATLTVDDTAACLDTDWTGATNTPTLVVTAQLNFYNDCTFIAAMAITGLAGVSSSIAGSGTLTTNGVTVGCAYIGKGSIGAGTLILGDNLITSGFIIHNNGTLNINGQTVTCTTVTETSANARTLTLGAATINCTAWDYSGSNLTITANTATIKITGTGALTGGAADYNGADFELNGTAHTVSGTFTCTHLTRTGTAAACTVTFNSNFTCIGTLTLNGNAAGNRLTVGGTASILTCLSFAGNHVDFSTSLTLILTNAGAGGTTFAGNGQAYPHVRVEGAGAYTLTITGDNTFEKLRNDSSVAVKTILLTPTSTQTIRNLQVFSSAANVAVFQTGGAAATIKGHRGYCELNHVDLTNIVATEKYRYYAGNNSTDGGGNTNWIFTHKARPEI